MSAADELMDRWMRDDLRLQWIVVPACEVRKGDIYANHATVTASRRARPGEGYSVKVDGEAVPVEEQWHFRCGKSLSVTCHRGKPTVVGRRS